LSVRAGHPEREHEDGKEEGNANTARDSHLLGPWNL
jgi:hypothetical protein